MTKKKVVVAMSGGVDSSVAAAILLEQGYEVTGVTMHLRDTAPAEGKACADCCSSTAVEDAARVADMLGIAHHVMNLREVFAEKVIDYFTSEYLRGRTPNPCIACNRYIKFGALLTRALDLGVEYVATGHYARLGFNEKYGRYTVCRAVDRSKDQTYVLYNLTQYQIAHTLMPLGDYTKGQVRRMAAGLGLPVAGKAESQEICFVTDDNYRRFLQEKTAAIKPGPFLNMADEVIGEHKGVPFYTVGQRRGLGLAAGERLYVVNIDAANNTITLGPESAIMGNALLAKDINLILYDELTGPMAVEAQIRYNGKPAPASLVPLPGGAVQVRFAAAQRAITPGQAVVFYQGDYLVGGATIERPVN